MEDIGGGLGGLFDTKYLSPFLLMSVSAYLMYSSKECFSIALRHTLVVLEMH